MGSARGAVLAAGALAAAVTAVLALVLALVPHHRARHPDVEWERLDLVSHDQTLREFATRVQRQKGLVGSMLHAGIRRHAVTGADTPYVLAASQTVTTPSPSPRRTRRALRRLGPVSRPYARNVVARVNRRFRTSGACASQPNSIACGLRSLLPAAAHDEDGNLVPNVVAAKRLVKFLHTVRTRASAPLGVYLSLDLRLRDLADERVLLTFAVLRTDGSIELPGRWAREFVAFDLTPKTNDQHLSTRLWVPEPHRRARYLVELYALERTGQISSQNSSGFR